MRRIKIQHTLLSHCLPLSNTGCCSRRHETEKSRGWLVNKNSDLVFIRFSRLCFCVDLNFALTLEDVFKQMLECKPPWPQGKREATVLSTPLYNTRFHTVFTFPKYTHTHTHTHNCGQGMPYSYWLRLHETVTVARE